MTKLLLAGAAALALTACEGTAPTPTAAGDGTGTTEGTGGTGGTGSLINVNLENIAATIAENVNIALEDVPITIQLPITIAANVCGVNVNVLSIQIDTAANSCTATGTSPELEQEVSNRVGRAA